MSTTPPRPTRLADSPQMRERISAYPSNITYLDLIRRNKRESALLMVGLVLLGVVIGGIIAASIATYAGAVESPVDLVPSIIVGCVAALIFASMGAAWSWFSGASAILRMAGAREIQKADDPELFNVVEEMAIAAGLPRPRVYIINDTALNAFATGRDPEHGVVAITKGLREKLTRDELQGVIAHEMAHIRHFDIRFAMLMATMVGLIVFACDAFLRIAFRGGMMRGGGKRSGGKGGGAAVVVILVIALVLAVVAPLFAKFLQMAYSRKREYLADAGAVELTRNPEGLASALSKLATDRDPLVDTANRGTAHMYIVNPLRNMRKSGQSLNTIFSSHPPIQDRIARLLALTR